jgi:hypothetical protein
MTTPTNTPPEHRRAPRSSTTGEEGRFPHTTESAKDLPAIMAELKRRGEPATIAAACRFALAFTREKLGLKP